MKAVKSNLHSLFVKHGCPFLGLLNETRCGCGREESIILTNCLRFATEASLLTRMSTIGGWDDARDAESIVMGFQHYILALQIAVMIPSYLVPLMGGGDGDKVRVV